MIQLRTIALHLLLLLPFTIVAQQLQEMPPPYNIKTVSFIQSGENVYPYFKLGESFQLAFDDLFIVSLRVFFTVKIFRWINITWKNIAFGGFPVGMNK